MVSIAWPAWGDIGVNSSIALTEFEIVPSQGTLHFVGPIRLDLSTEARPAAIIHQSATVYDAVASVVALTATATGSALALTGAVTGTAGVSSLANANESFTGMFEILGATGPVSVQFIANINYAQSLAELPLPAQSRNISSRVGFTVVTPDVVTPYPGHTVINLISDVGIEPGGSAFRSFSGPVSGSARIVAGTPVSFEVSLESLNVDTPEPAWILLILPVLTLLFLRRRLSCR